MKSCVAHIALKGGSGRKGTMQGHINPRARRIDAVLSCKEELLKEEVGVILQFSCQQKIKTPHEQKPQQKFYICFSN